MRFSIDARRFTPKVPELAMPIYAYQCSQCGAREEHLQKVDDAPVETCAACGGKLARTLTAAAFHLKGGGWYKDGYASSKPEGGDTGSSSGDSASSTTSEKPAAAPKPTGAASE